MKTRTTKTTNGHGLQSHPEQWVRAPEGEFNKYIVLRWQGREQVTVFPLAMRHAEVFGYMRQECPELEAVSAGLFIVTNAEVWTMGNSESLQLSCRPQDAKVLESFFASPDRQVWDLIRLSEEARDAARTEMAEAGWCSTNPQSTTKNN